MEVVFSTLLPLHETIGGELRRDIIACANTAICASVVGLIPYSSL
ncbi:MAG: hypothetical protein WCJ19_04000 [bacterium]